MAERLRSTLDGAWAELCSGHNARAAVLLEQEVMGAICDIETWEIDNWERTRAGLEARRPDVSWDLGE